MYRPEGYQEILARTMGAIAPIDAKLVEAGADAMLEGLMREGIDYSEPSIICAEDNTVTYKGKKGKLVFIEEKR